MEIQSGRAFHAVLEAKRDWELPSGAQLKRYAPRLAVARARRRRLVTVSAADADFAARKSEQWGAIGLQAPAQVWSDGGTGAGLTGSVRCGIPPEKSTGDQFRALQIGPMGAELTSF